MEDILAQILPFVNLEIIISVALGIILGGVLLEAFRRINIAINAVWYLILQRISGQNTPNGSYIAGACRPVEPK